MADRLASISIDLDGLPHYEALHGLPSQSKADAVMRLAPARLAELLGPRRGTFFAIANELPPGGEPLRALVAQGHEVGNHTRSHPYGLTQLAEADLHLEVAGGAALIAERVGVRPAGFRAPGYTLSAGLLDAVLAAGHLYDSSAFPAVPYYLAKAFMLGLLRLRGRTSAAVLDRPRVLRAPLRPYRPARTEPYQRGDHGLIELPIAVDPITRLPFIGTLVVSLPFPLVRAAYLSVRRMPFLNLELHGVDLLDHSDGIGPALTHAQPDLGISARVKLRRLREVFKWIADDYEIVPLVEAARRLAP